MVDVGTRERPRLLVFGVDPDAPLGQHLASIAPTIRFMSGEADDDLDSVRQGDWDAIVFWDTYYDVEDHLFVLQFGGIDAGFIHLSGVARGRIGRFETTRAVEFSVPDSLPADIRELARTDIAPAAIAAGSTACLGLVRSGPGLRSPNWPEARFESFVVDGDGGRLAGRYPRTGAWNGAEWWTIPKYTASPERWATVAFAHWSSILGDVFPGDPDWTQKGEWLTGEEEKVVAAQARLEEEHLQATLAYEEAKAALAAQFEDAQAAAAAGDRRLLTAQGSDLVEEVIEALQELGFEVIDADAEISAEGDRREDLRISDPDEPGWIALAEVRGYARGAQLRDLLRIGRFQRRFATEEGRDPDAVWYVVNHHLGSDPSQRPQALQSNAAEVETFAEDGGLVMDTRDLFALRKQVRDKRITARDARVLCRGQGSGRLELAQ